MEFWRGVIKEFWEGTSKGLKMWIKKKNGNFDIIFLRKDPWAVSKNSL